MNQLSEVIINGVQRLDTLWIDFGGNPANRNNLTMPSITYVGQLVVNVTHSSIHPCIIVIIMTAVAYAC